MWRTNVREIKRLNWKCKKMRLKENSYRSRRGRLINMYHWNQMWSIISSSKKECECDKNDINYEVKHKCDNFNRFEQQIKHALWKWKKKDLTKGEMEILWNVIWNVKLRTKKLWIHNRRNENEQFRKFPCEENLFKNFDREIFEDGKVGFKVKWKRSQRGWWKSVTNEYGRGRWIAFDRLNLRRIYGYN